MTERKCHGKMAFPLNKLKEVIGELYRLPVSLNRGTFTAD